MNKIFQMDMESNKVKNKYMKDGGKMGKKMEKVN